MTEQGFWRVDNFSFKKLLGLTHSFPSEIFQCSYLLLKLNPIDVPQAMIS